MTDFNQQLCDERHANLDEKLDRHTEKLNEILSVLKGKGDDVGLCEKVRSNERYIKGALAAVVFSAGVVITQFVVWLRQRINGV